MKKIVLYTFIALVLSFSARAQIQNLGINYQIQIRNNAGILISDSVFDLRISLLPSQFSTQLQWQEEFTCTTDRYGMAGIVIGKGVRKGGTANSFQQVDFSTGNFWIQVEIKNNKGGTYRQLGSSEPFQSVPYAKAAGNASPIPSGFIMPFAGDTLKIPQGWLLCDGRTVNRNVYKDLYNVIGDNWGRGDNSTTFNLPDLRGQFLRGVSDGTSIDPDASKRYYLKNGGNVGDRVGSYQDFAFQGHFHQLWHNGGYYGGGNNWAGITSNSPKTLGTVTNTPVKEAITDDVHGTPHVADETRPKNAYVYFLIKY